jgi:hypothetical protein
MEIEMTEKAKKLLKSIEFIETIYDEWADNWEYLEAQLGKKTCDDILETYSLIDQAKRELGVRK